MSGLGGQIADRGAIGTLPRQHFDPDWSIPNRIVTYSCRVRRTTRDGFLGLPAYEQEDGEDVVGDDQGVLFWRREGTARECSAFWLGPVPSVVAAGPQVPTRTRPRAPGPPAGGGSSSVLPLRALDTPDDRFRLKAAQVPPWATKFPGRWTGLTGRASEEYSQVETWHPDFLGLVAANRGNPDLGTRVFDVLGGQLDTERRAYLQDLVSVVELGASSKACGILGKGLALQLGRGGKNDAGPGYALWIDYDFNEIGVGATKGGGFLTAGQGACQHDLGEDVDGNSIHPMHGATSMLFLGHGGDAPLDFSTKAWIPPNQIPFPIWKKVELRLDAERFHRAGCTGGVGFWAWQVDVPFYVPPPWTEPPPPQPPEPPPPMRLPEPRVYPPNGSRPGPVTGGFLPGGGGIGSDPGPDLGGIDPVDSGLQDAISGGVTVASPDQPTDSIDPVEAGLLDAIISGLSDEDQALLNAMNYGAHGGKTPLIGAGGWKPAYATSTMGVAVPALIVKGTATNTGEAAIPGSRVLTDGDRARFERAPQVAQIVGWAAGTGTWDGFDNYRDGDGLNYAMAAGGPVILPPDTTLAELLACTATTESPVAVVLPPGLTQLAFAKPMADGGLKTGFVVESPTGGASLTTTHHNATGVAGADSLLTSGGRFRVRDSSGAVSLDVSDGVIAAKEVDTPTTPASGVGGFYTNTSGEPYHVNDAGTDTALTPSGGSGAGAIGGYPIGDDMDYADCETYPLTIDGENTYRIYDQISWGAFGRPLITGNIDLPGGTENDVALVHEDQGNSYGGAIDVDFAEADGDIDVLLIGPSLGVAGGDLTTGVTVYTKITNTSWDDTITLLVEVLSPADAATTLASASRAVTSNDAAYTATTIAAASLADMAAGDEVMIRITAGPGGPAGGTVTFKLGRVDVA